MKTWEVIKELTEHSEKKFKCKDGVFGGCTMDNTHWTYTMRNHRLLVNADWQEVKPKVGWDKALEHMRKHLDNSVSLFRRQYRIGHELGWFEQYSMNGNWGNCSINIEMLDSKEWELL